MPAKGKHMDLSGKKFGKLTAIRFSHAENGQSFWECKCECGSSCVSRAGNLKSGSTKSCGCLKHESHNCKPIDLSGKRFGMLTVLQRSTSNKTMWQCICDCGNTSTVYRGHLRGGLTRSCGCEEGNRKHGMSNTRQYGIWRHMRNRCENPNYDQYEDYGGRGISVCDKWTEFTEFWNDMKGSYAENLTIERIDNNGNYEPSNCRWATMAEQGCNTRRTINICFRGETKTLSEWSRIVNMNWTTLNGRIKRGWGIERTLTEPSLRPYPPGAKPSA